MLHLHIPTGERTNLRDAVFSVLSHNESRSLMQLHNEVKKRFNLSVTYQATRKSVDYLLKHEVVVKDGKNYSLNPRWVLESKKFFDGLLEKKPSKNIFCDYSEYSFSTLFELDNFWSELLDHIGKEEPGDFFGQAHYPFWMFINTGQETKLFKKLKKNNRTCDFVLQKDCAVNTLVKKLYEGVGVQTVIRSGGDDSSGLNILGSTIIQVTYDAQITRSLSKFFTRKKMDDAALQELAEIVHKPCSVKLVLFRNEAVAKELLASHNLK